MVFDGGYRPGDDERTVLVESNAGGRVGVVGGRAERSDSESILIIKSLRIRYCSLFKGWGSRTSQRRWKILSHNSRNRHFSVPGRYRLSVQA